MRRRRGCTLVELLYIVGILGGVATSATLALLGATLSDVLLGGLLGFVALPLGLPALLFVMLTPSLLRSWWRDRWWPPRPPCFAGRCRADEYECTSRKPSRFRCRCGHRYVQRDDRFLRVIGGEIQLAYMIRDQRGRWVPEPKRVVEPPA
jgi:hypothetical protein